MRKIGMLAVGIGSCLVALMLYFTPLAELSFERVQAGQTPEEILGPTRIEADLEVSQILEMMLTSHTAWERIAVTSQTTWFVGENSGQPWTTTLHIQQPNRVRMVLLAEGEAEPTVTWIMNGEQVFEREPPNEPTVRPIAGFVRDETAVVESMSDFPTRLSEIERVARTIYRHPVGMQIPSPMADYLYPLGLAQRGGSYTLLAEERVAGRETWLVEWVEEAILDKPPSLRQLFWVDKGLGIILKVESYAGADLAEMIEQTVVLDIEIDPALDATLFELPAASPVDAQSWVTTQDNLHGITYELPETWKLVRYSYPTTTYIGTDMKLSEEPLEGPDRDVTYNIFIQTVETAVSVEEIPSELSPGDTATYRYEEKQFGPHLGYVTDEWPSAKGMLSVIVELEGRFLIFNLYPYDSIAAIPTPERDAEILPLFEQLIASVAESNADGTE